MDLDSFPILPDSPIISIILELDGLEKKDIFGDFILIGIN